MINLIWYIFLRIMTIWAKEPIIIHYISAGDHCDQWFEKEREQFWYNALWYFWVNISLSLTKKKSMYIHTGSYVNQYFNKRFCKSNKIDLSSTFFLKKTTRTTTRLFDTEKIFIKNVFEKSIFYRANFRKNFSKIFL